MTLAIILSVLALLGLWVGFQFNQFVRLRQHVREAWSDIDSELKRRWDLIPNLVEIARGYAAHEKETFERVTQARNAARSAGQSLGEKATREEALGGAVDRLMMLSEAYPELKANENFLQLQRELAQTEDRIAQSRRFYNANVRELNNRVEMFPSMLFAQLFGFKRAEYFQLDHPDEAQSPNIADAA